MVGALLVVGPANAAEPFVVIGPGSVECCQALELKQRFEAKGRADEFDTAIAAYAHGFWSGLNFGAQMRGDKSGQRALNIGRDEITRGILARFTTEPTAPLFTHLWVMFNQFDAAGPD